ncbi:MAG TPA: dienelactone hydrolase family protein, partial [Burkholderiales bacterium]|nr:dienelactone hydrolase family protein [Burkholderiales bacterium]
MEDSRRDLKDDHLNSLLPDVQVDRRGFVAACIAAGFAVTAEPLLAQAIKTSMDGLDGGDVKIGEIPAYFAVPKGKGKRPVILVVPEIWGNHEHIKDVVRRVAKAGYFAVANEPYFRIGDLTKLENIKEVIAGANKLSDQQAFEDLDAVVAWAGKHARANVDKLGITGFCRGGRMVWMYTAHNKKVDAGVAWYGSLMPIPPAMPSGPLDVTDKIDRPVLGLYGSADQGIPLEHVERLRAGLKAFGNDRKSTIHVYEGMPHAFNADYRPSYRKEAADDGWKRMLAWFKKNGVA